ncbi:MAG: AIPR family protein [Lysobacterales bacterium]
MSAFYIWSSQSGSSNGSGSIAVGDVQKYIQGFRDLINARLDRFNGKIQKRKSEINQALDDAKTRIIMILVYTGTQPLSQEVNNLIEDLKSEINDPTELLIVKPLRQVNLYSSIAHGAEAQPINVEVGLQSWGQVREPYQAYYGQVAATEVAEWWRSHFPHVFAPNIRIYLGNTDVNNAILETIATNPESFWYFNNGITALCGSITKKPLGGSGRDMGIFDCQDFRIVNGAQTVGSIAAAAEKYPQAIEQAKVPIRIVSLADSPEGFGRSITRTNNTQNRIDRRDFVALDGNQERIRSELHLEGVSYVYKSGDVLAQGVAGFDLVEATVALACVHPDLSLAVQAKREIGKLWDDIEKAPYKALFNEGISGPQLWRYVQVLRVIERALDSSKADGGRARLCAVHGNRLIAHMVFRSLEKGILNEFGEISDAHTSEIAEITQNAYEHVFSALEERYPDSYPASLFKNMTKSKDVVGAASE